VEPRRSLGDGPPGPEELGHPLVVEGGHDRRDELTTEELRPGLVEEDGRDVIGDAGTSPIEVDEVAGEGRPHPGIDRRGSGTRPLRQLVAAQAVRAGRLKGGEQPELEPEVGGPAPIEAADARRQVVVSIVEAHGRIVAPDPVKRDPGNVLVRISK
jgi:hypothetical protein